MDHNSFTYQKLYPNRLYFNLLKAITQLYAPLILHSFLDLDDDLELFPSKIMLASLSSHCFAAKVEPHQTVEA